MLKDHQRMIGTWYDAHSNDGGFVLIRIRGAAQPLMSPITPCL
jgi:hypothetical protein